MSLRNALPPATNPASEAVLPTLLQTPESLAEILMRASTFSRDRRKTRYPRLRKAVEAGLESASVLSAKQPKGKRRKLNNAGVDPQLPEDVATYKSEMVRARIINLPHGIRIARAEGAAHAACDERRVWP